jgi:hypothetical protein
LFLSTVRNSTQTPSTLFELIASVMSVLSCATGGRTGLLAGLVVWLVVQLVVTISMRGGDEVKCDPLLARSLLRLRCDRFCSHLVAHSIGHNHNSIT